MLETMGTANKADFWFRAKSHGYVMTAIGRGLRGEAASKSLRLDVSGKKVPDFSKEREVYAHFFFFFGLPNLPFFLFKKSLIEIYIQRITQFLSVQFNLCLPVQPTS